MFRKKKIILYYFYFQGKRYAPVDIGYILAAIKKNIGLKYKFELVGHSVGRAGSQKDIENIISKEVDRVTSMRPKAVFFFADNILWSKLHAVGRAKKIAIEMKKKCPDLHIGIQSYKFHKDHIREIFSSRAFDSAIGNDPERSFLFLEKIIKKEAVAGVIYKNNKGDLENFIHFSEPNVNVTQKNLDHIPSPYLSGVLDEFLLNCQARTNNSYTAFLYSSRGCRFGCYYCSRSVKFEKLSFFSVERFYDEMEYINRNFGITRFFVLDDAFLFSQSRLEAFIVEFELRKRKFPNLGRVTLIVMARPESLSEIMIKLLKKINVIMVQLGLQTVNPDLQKYMNRQVSIERFAEISSELRNDNINFLIDVIVGLPGDSIGYLKKTIDYAISLRPHSMQVKQLYLNPGTLFYVRQKEYGIMAETVEKDFYVPYVYKTFGKVDGEYHRVAYEYISDTIKNHPEIKWRFMTQLGAYISSDFGNPNS